MKGFLGGLRLGGVGVVIALAIAALPQSARAILILGIDIDGDIHRLSTNDGSFTTLGSTGLPSAHTLDRAPHGSLYTFSRVGDNEVHLIDEGDYSTTSVVASGTTITGGEGGLAFTSNSTAYATTRAAGVFPFLLELDLNSGNLIGSQVLDQVQEDISALTLRDDGILVGIARESNDLLAINPATAEISVIANLSGLTVLNTGGLAQIDGVAYFATSLAGAGSDTEIWSVDLYSGAHAHETTVVGLSGITGIAAIPEPGTAVLFALGLAMLSSRRRRGALSFLALVIPMSLSAQSASAGEVEDLLDEACKSGLLGPAQCAELLACIEDPSTCSSSSSFPTASGFAAASSATGAGGGGMAMMMGPVTGASFEFRIDNSQNPKLSPSGARIAFEETNGPQRTHRAVFGDGIPGGTQMPSPSPFGAHSTLLGAIDDGGFVVGTRAQTSPTTDNEAYIADGSVAVVLPNTNTLGTMFDFTSAFDSNVNSTAIAGSVYDQSFGIFGKNFPALWEDNGSTVTLRIFNGLSPSASLNIGEFRALTPAGTFAVGTSGSANTPPGDAFGRQAFFFSVAGNSFTALPFLPSAGTNRSDANALSDATDIIVGTARNASGDDVATIWFFNGTGYSVFELPRFGAATTSRGLAAAGDGFSLGGSVGNDAAVWNGLTFEARRLADYVAGLGLTIPPECTLSNVTDMDLTGVRLVGEATCDTGAGPFTRVYELETPVPLPEPGFGVASLLGALGLFLSKSRSPR